MCVCVSCVGFLLLCMRVCVCVTCKVTAATPPLLDLPLDLWDMCVCVMCEVFLDL